jgi:hypothetical protein
LHAHSGHQCPVRDDLFSLTGEYALADRLHDRSGRLHLRSHIATHPGRRIRGLKSVVKKISGEEDVGGGGDASALPLFFQRARFVMQASAFSQIKTMC